MKKELTTVNRQNNAAKNVKGILGGVLLFGIIFLSLIGPLVYQVDPRSTNLLQRLQPPALFSKASEHFLGTDQLGRDILSRLIYGARISLFVSLCSILIAIFLGVTLGMLAGYYGGWFDNLLMRIGDVQLSIPFLVLAISVIAVLGSGLVNVVLILGVTGWIQFGRVVRAETMHIKEREFVSSAIALGASDIRILFVHILPNIIPTTIVLTTFQFALLIIVESSLSFLGLGVQPPAASWGSMINDGKTYIQTAWWLSTIPGCMITLLVLGANLFGDWLRDRLDPHLQQQA